jgi:NADH-quinone oxidoreductase subunit C
MPINEVKTALAAIAVQVAAAEAGEGAPACPLVVETERAVRGTDLEVTVPPERITDAARILDEAQYMLEAITAIDWPDERRMEIVYDCTHTGSGQRVTVRAFVPREQPELPTLSGIYPGAEWHERETHDFFGVIFTGHPNLAPLLLPEDADFHPLRKDFEG